MGSAGSKRRTASGRRRHLSPTCDACSRPLRWATDTDVLPPIRRPLDTRSTTHGRRWVVDPYGYACLVRDPGRPGYPDHRDTCPHRAEPELPRPRRDLD